MDELIGKLAIVDPNLPYDFFRSQSKLGTISSLIPKTNEAMLDFGGVEINYRLDDLLILRPLHMIRKYIIRSNHYLSKQDFANLQYIHDLIASDREKNLKEAFAYCMQGHSLRDIAFISACDWVTKGLKENPNEQISHGSRRRR